MWETTGAANRRWSGPMSITTKIIAPIWILGLALAGLAILLEKATLGPLFSESTSQSTEALVRAVGAVAATSTDTPGSMDRAVSMMGDDDYVRLIVVAGGHPERVIAEHQPCLPRPGRERAACSPSPTPPGRVARQAVAHVVGRAGRHARRGGSAARAAPAPGQPTAPSRS